MELNKTGTIILYSIVMVICELLSKGVRKGKGQFRLLIIILVLSFLAGLRGLDVGTDTRNYSASIMYAGMYNSRFEPGYIMLSYLLHTIDGGYTAAFVGISLITNTLIILRLYELSDYTPLRYSFLAYYIMCYFMTMSGIRQWLAIAIVFWGTGYLMEKNKPIRFIPICIVAMLFHYSSILSVLYLFPYLVSYNTNNSRKKLARKISIILLPILFIAGIYVFNQYYRDYSFMSGTINVGFSAFVKIVILTCIIIQKRKLLYENVDINILIFCETVVIFGTFVSYFSRNTWRLCWPFLIMSPVLYGKILSMKTRKINNISFTKLLIICVLVVTYCGIFNEAGDLCPYSFVKIW